MLIMTDTRFDNEIDFLLSKACGSIRYLVMRDLLGVPVDSAEMTALEEKILAQPNVKKILAVQCEDGWFGHELHGNDGMDHLVGELLNAGVEASHPAIQKAIRALVTPEIASNHKNWFRGGDALDAGGRGGNRAVTAQILSWVHYPEDHPLMKEQIALSLEHMTAAANYTSIDDFSVSANSKRFYKPNARFPGANHIAMLAATESWRTDENVEAVRRAAAHAYELMRDVDEYITFKKPAEFGGGFVGPFNYNWQALTPMTEEKLLSIINGPYSFGFAFWLGSVTGVPEFMPKPSGTYELLSDLLRRGDIDSLIPDEAYRAFRQVMGKEPTLRRRCAKKCDLTYALLRACWGTAGR